MRFGLLADIHEHVDFLRLAIARLQEHGVDCVIVLGDVFETGTRLAETVKLLTEAGACGVWGNHDFGLCRDPHEEMRDRYGEAVLTFFGKLAPTLEIEDVLFTHVEPWRDAEDILDLWCFEQELPAESFLSHPHRLMLHGHHHRWKVDCPDGSLPWDGCGPLEFEPDHRYVIQVGAVMNGQCGILDTSANELIPIDLRPHLDRSLIGDFGP